MSALYLHDNRNPLYVDTKGNIIYINKYDHYEEDEDGNVLEGYCEFEGIIVSKESAEKISKRLYKILFVEERKGYAGDYNECGIYEGSNTLCGDLVKKYIPETIVEVNNDYFC